MLVLLFRYYGPSTQPAQLVVDGAWCWSHPLSSHPVAVNWHLLGARLAAGPWGRREEGVT